MKDVNLELFKKLEELVDSYGIETVIDHVKRVASGHGYAERLEIEPFHIEGEPTGGKDPHNLLRHPGRKKQNK